MLLKCFSLLRAMAHADMFPMNGQHNDVAAQAAEIRSEQQMFLKPEQQLERCKRIVRQRVDPHIHPSIARLAVESFDIPGEPMPTDEFFAKLNRGTSTSSRLRSAANGAPHGARSGSA